MRANWERIARLEAAFGQHFLLAAGPIQPSSAGTMSEGEAAPPLGVTAGGRAPADKLQVVHSRQLKVLARLQQQEARAGVAPHTVSEMSGHDRTLQCQAIKLQVRVCRCVCVAHAM